MNFRNELKLFKDSIGECRVDFAKKLAQHYHKDDLYDNQPYFETHLLGVYKKVKSDYPDNYDLQIVALLHDVFEDHDADPWYLLSAFGDDVVRGITAISYFKEVDTREEYLKGCLENKYSCIVKKYDAQYNKETSYSQHDLHRAEYYARIEKRMSDKIEESYTE